ncbi:hypothetical protein [Paenibacillus sp. Mc5Re-14]|uniref:hypothetical protein n=1 Tax=Paenibacillus sp. Mc5Re-14 TaxID=1030529 RepID=UPI002100468E|nr:hypothetical protein [Paenibacillus sp. Mc5Re-14]
MTVAWSEQETRLLLQESHRAYNTEVNDLLLTALGSALYNWSGQKRVLVNLEGMAGKLLFQMWILHVPWAGLQVSIRAAGCRWKGGSRAAHQAGKRGPASCAA